MPTGCCVPIYPMYDGIYNASKKHDPDRIEVIARAKRNGLDKVIVAGTSYETSANAISLASKDGLLAATVGCHPTHCMEIHDPAKYFQKMQLMIEENRHAVVAIGECGLDYERVQFCPKEIQTRYLIPHFDLAEYFNLPMLLHNRKSTSDLVEIIRKQRDKFPRGVVHSFDGTKEEAQALLDLDLYIGING
ncbi:putative deoxyribonuclease TATDN1 [Nymphon striatum]|nr:putative deoxyribonuclease TATDN1 [Nymphon striatum]